jgi:hypothetical protein
MPVAIFDFDETLVCLPSGLVWSRSIPFTKRILFPILFLIEKYSGASVYHRKLFDWLIGSDISTSIARMNILPPAANGVSFFNKLSADGYKMIVMSYSPGVFVESWLAAYHLSAEITCPSLIISEGLVRKVSDDPVTEIYLRKPDGAKAKILGKYEYQEPVRQPKGCF